MLARWRSSFPPVPCLRPPPAQQRWYKRARPKPRAATPGPRGNRSPRAARKMEERPIPSFYCCYLLRSANKRSLYVGSTPDPRRRLSQHNGESNGGARKTHRESLRPWEMTCVVSGFPSRIAALQFEWAWQNPHLSLKIPPDQRIAAGTRKSSSGRRRPKRPPCTLTGNLEYLHLLLRIDAFSRWPLSVRFFSNDVYKAWNLWCSRESTPLRAGITTLLDLRLSGEAAAEEQQGGGGDAPKKTKKLRKHSANGEGGLQGLDITYAHLDRHLQKSRDLLLHADLECGVCRGPLEVDHSSTLVCPHAFCEHLAHMACLAGKFLRQEAQGASSAKARPMVLPTDGRCPGCQTPTTWIEVVKELNVRTRVKPKKTAARRKKGVEEDEEDDGSEDEEEEEEGDITAADLAEREGEQVTWDQDTDTDPSSAGSDAGSVKGKRRGKEKTRGGSELPVVIEDSDMESVISDAASDRASVRGKRTSKEKAPRGKKLPAMGGDSSPDSDSGNEKESARVKTKEKGKPGRKKKTPAITVEESPPFDEEHNSGSVKPTKAKPKTQRKKAPSLAAKDSSVLAGETGGGASASKKRGGGKAKGKKVPTVVVEDSDWDGVDTVL